MTGKILRRADVLARLGGRSTSQLYDDIAKGRFPAPIKIGARAVGWLEEEVDAWQRARVAERDARLAQRKAEAEGAEAA